MQMLNKRSAELVPVYVQVEVPSRVGARPDFLATVSSVISIQAS
jgi:hypothetical protein